MWDECDGVQRRKGFGELIFTVRQAWFMTTSYCTPPFIEGDITDIYFHGFPQSFASLCECVSLFFFWLTLVGNHLNRNLDASRYGNDLPGKRIGGLCVHDLHVGEALLRDGWTDRLLHLRSPSIIYVLLEVSTGFSSPQAHLWLTN